MPPRGPGPAAARSTPPATKGATDTTPSHVDRARLPLDQNVIDRIAAEVLSADTTAIAAMAKAVTATPARSSVTTSGRRSRIDTDTTTTVAIAAPMQAIAAVSTVLNEAPTATAAMAPRAAPADTPTRPGSASGLPREPCISAPAIARPDPTSSAITTRGARMLHTISAVGSAIPTRSAMATAASRTRSRAVAMSQRRALTS